MNDQITKNQNPQETREEVQKAHKHHQMKKGGKKRNSMNLQKNRN